eukprot:Sspe_Gene.51098::Locus_28387_Transcript_1_1_Confidence_1.000_Length_622::g.51098::m.51098/K14560/IMP3; U3 small nucleolar ribonucleoprotein protein IMP3
MQITEQMLEKLFNMGVVENKDSLTTVEKLTTASFCKRRIPVVMVKQKMAQNLQMAVKLVEQGHVRVGPHQVTDPAFLVTRHMEDHVQWSNGAIKEKVLKYNRKLDDYDMLND